MQRARESQGTAEKDDYLFCHAGSLPHRRVGTRVPPPGLSPLPGLKIPLWRIPTTSSPLFHPSTRKPRVPGTPVRGSGVVG
jgi:hypothetical protein